MNVSNAIQKIHHLLQNTDLKDIEIELRFGKTDKNKKYIPEVDRQFFIQLKEYADKTFSNMEYTHSLDRIYDGNVKYTVFLNNGLITHPGIYYKIVKVPIFKETLADETVRISVAKEIITEEPSLPNELPLFVRDKKRYSYMFQGLTGGTFRLDCTEVTLTTKNTNTKTIYEVEIEIIDFYQEDSPSKLESLQKIPDVLKVMFQKLYNTTLLFSQTERSQIIKNINKYLNNAISDARIDHTFLAQARNIKANDLTIGKLISNDPKVNLYTVTDKANGKRKFLVIDPSGIYLIFPPVFIDKIVSEENTKTLSKYYGTIIEGEFIEEDDLIDNSTTQLPLFLLYDIVSYAGNTEVQKEPLLTRQNVYLKNVYDALKLRQKLFPYFNIEMKEFIPFNTRDEFYVAVNKILDKKFPYHIDGLIFTPSNTSYSERYFTGTNMPDILKWKYPEELTIDLLVMHTPTEDGQNLILYMVDKNHNLTQFKGNGYNPFNIITDLEVNDLLRSAPSNSIVEFAWNYDTKKLYAKKIRTNKTLPNKVGIVLDVWEDIHKPLSKDLIIGNQLGLQFRYHNRIKTRLYELAKNAKTLLTIGAGRGGDVQKWINMKYTHVVCVEPNPINIITLQKRLETTKLNFLIIQARGQDTDLIASEVKKFIPGGKVDVISYMLSLSFFFDSPESLQSVIDLTQETLKSGGYFIALSIDKKYVLEYLNSPNQYQFKNLTFEFNEITQQVFIDIPNSIVEKQIEWLADIDLLKSKFKQLGYKLIGEGRADKEGFLNDDELVLSKMYSYFILMK